MIIELPNGQELEFPDNTPPAVMRAAIANQFPEYANGQGQPPKRTGWEGVVQDIGEGVSGIPSTLGALITELPGQAASSVGQIATDPGRAATNLGAGFLEGLKGLVNVPSNIAGYLGSRDIGQGAVQNAIQGLHIGDTGLEQRVFGAPQPGDELLRGLTSFLGGGGGVGLAAKGIRGLAKRAGGNALYAAGQEQNPVEAMLLGLGGEGLGKGLQKVSNSSPFTPSSPLTNEELAKSLALTRGTETGLGDVLENPFLKKTLENRLPDIPFSGATQAMQRTAQEVTNRGQNIMKQLGAGADTSNAGQSLKEALSKADREVRGTKTQKFNQLNSAAEKEGVTTDRAGLRKVARDLQADIHADKDLSHVTDPKLKSLVDKLSEGKKAEEFSIKNTDLLRAKLGDLAAESFDKGNNGLGMFYTRLREAADKDIQRSVEKSGSPQLKKLHNDAFDYYKNKFLEFEDPNIRKFTFGNGDPDLLVSHFLRKSIGNDRSNLLNKLTSKLTPKERDLMAHRYFSTAVTDGELNPMKFKTLYKALGEKQKENLFGKQKVQQLNNYIDLVQKNTDPLTIMFNPKTGARNTGSLPWLTSASGLGAALMTGEPLTGLAVAGAPIVAGRPLTKYLTNEARREKVVNDIIKSRMKAAQPANTGSPFINALLQASQTYPSTPANEREP